MAVDLQNRDLRQRDLVPPAKLQACRILVIGVGAVGRQVALQLAAMGAVDLTLMDFDQVDVVNLAPQGYLPDDVGQPKVEATAAWCRRLNPMATIRPVAERFRRSSTRTLTCFNEPNGRPPIVFCCVDSITARSLVWESVKDQAGFFTDARMSAETVRILTADLPGQDDRYASTLFSQAEAYSGSCTSKSTIYAASIAAGLMLTQFTRWLRELPVEHDALLNLLAGELTVR